MDAIFFRGVERLLIVGGGILSISFGYLLFKKSITDLGDLIASNGKFQISLSNVGSGVFFSFFGMSILVASMLTQLEQKIESDSSTSKEVVDHQKTSNLKSNEKATYVTNFYNDGPGQTTWASSRMAGMLALNKSIDFLNSPPKDQKESNEAQEAAKQLLDFRSSFIDREFGASSFNNYSSIKSDISKLKTLTKKEQDKFDEIKLLVESR